MIDVMVLLMVEGMMVVLVENNNRLIFLSKNKTLANYSARVLFVKSKVKIVCVSIL